MPQRKWVLTVTVVAITLVGAVAVAGARTGWFSHRARTVPTCAEIFADPAVDDAVRTAFAITWDQRARDFIDFDDDASLCNIRADALFFGAERPEAGTPKVRYLTVHLFREELEFFRGTADWMCKESSAATGFADEPGLGDEAFSCWTSDPDGSQRYFDRNLHFRVGGLSVWVELLGENHGPRSAADFVPRLQADLAHNARCIAEAVATRFDPRTAQTRTCFGTARDM